MPEVSLTIQLPDGTTRTCYSPSTILLEHLRPGESMSVAKFREAARTGLTRAADRVEEKLGFRCTGATRSLAEVEDWTRSLPDDHLITILET